MKVLLLVKNFDLGGTEVHVRELANGLAEAGHRVFVMSRSGRQVECLNAGVTFIQHRFTDFGLLGAVSKVRTLIWSEKIEIIHGHQRLPILIAAIVKILTGISSVATIHGRISLDSRPAFMRRWIDRMIVVAPNRLSNLRERDVIRDKCCVIYNGLALEGREPSRDKIQGLNLLYASRIDRRHGQALITLLKEVWPSLLRQFPNAKLHIAGDGNRLTEVQEVAKPFTGPSEQSVVFHGFLPSLVPLFKETSLTLGVGRVAIESLALGIPVIPVNSAYWAPVISRENYKILKADNFVGRSFYEFEPEPLLAELQRVLGELDEIYCETQNLSEEVYQDFSLARMVNLVEKVYQELAD